MRSVTSPASAWRRSPSSFSCSCAYSLIHTWWLRIPRGGSPRKPRTVAKPPPSRIAGYNASFWTEPSSMPWTPSGTSARIRSATSSPRRTTMSAPSCFTSDSSFSEASAMTTKPSAFASWIT